MWSGSSFATLCEGPRSPNDYAEIAREFRTVLLSDVPVFTAPQQDNAARRFIALVDEFYDQGVKLVLSAAARAGAAVPRRAAAVRISPHRQPPGRDADRELPGATAPRLSAHPDRRLRGGPFGIR